MCAHAHTFYNLLYIILKNQNFMQINQAYKPIAFMNTLK